MPQGIGYGLEALRRLIQGGQQPEMPELPQAPPMFRRPGTLDEQPFRSQQPPPVDVRRPGAVAGPGVSEVQGGLGMTRTPGGAGLAGPEWALAHQGPSQPAPFYRPTEELYRQSFRPAEQIAPGAGQFAQTQLKERLGDEEFERALGQKQREIPAMAEAGLHPSVQRQQQLAAERALGPAREQARGLGLQSLYNFLGRQQTAGGTVEARRAQRDAAALNTLERGMSSIMEKEALTPQDAAELQRLRESIEQVKRGVFFMSDLFDENELDELADLEQGFGLDEEL